MHLLRREKTTFIGEGANYCYNVIPFNLKNAKVTYQRLIDMILHPMLGRNVES